MKFYNVCIDEDSRACIDSGDDILNFEFRGYINEQGLCGKENFDSLKSNFDEITTNDSFLQEDEEGQQELEKLNNNFKELLRLYNEHGGILLTWGVEYDQNWLLIYDCTVEEFDEWYNRKVDEKEFND